MLSYASSTPQYRHIADDIYLRIDFEHFSAVKNGEKLIRAQETIFAREVRRAPDGKDIEFSNGVNAMVFTSTEQMDNYIEARKKDYPEGAKL